jgi:cold shock protein
MKTATVKFWSQKGFGFLTPEDGSADVFAHISNVDEDLEELVRGMRVCYVEEVSSRRFGSRAGPIAARQKYSQIRVSTAEARTAAKATRNAVTTSWIMPRS